MANTGTVTPNGLNLRAAPGGAIIKVLPRGATVEIVEDQGDVLKVNAGGDVGFVAASFIKRDTPAAAPAPPASAGVGKVRFVGSNAVGPDGKI
ncbi:MAG: SH3 domain-containing protein, partial [Pyrinomonadaceae bacterium]